MFFFLLVFVQYNVNGFFFLLPRLPSFSWKYGPAIMSRGQTTKLTTKTNRWTLVIGSFIVRLVWFGWQRKMLLSLRIHIGSMLQSEDTACVLHWLAVSFAIRAQWGATVTGYEQSLFEDSDASVTATTNTETFHTTHTKASTRHNRHPPPTVLSLWTCSNWCVFDGLEEMWLIYWCFRFDAWFSHYKETFWNTPAVFLFKGS